MAIYAMTIIVAPVMILQGCAAPMIAAGASGLAGYQTMQVAGDSNENANFSNENMSCNDMRVEISALDRTIQNYYAHQANNNMQQYPTSAGTQVATQAATDIAAYNAPAAIAYIQPLMASAKGFLDKTMTGGNQVKITQAQSRKDYLSSQYDQKCSARVKGDPVTKEIQSLLGAMGYPCGVADGFAGKKTDAAIRKYQADRGLLVDGRASPALLAMMKREAPTSAYE